MAVVAGKHAMKLILYARKQFVQSLIVPTHNTSLRHMPSTCGRQYGDSLSVDLLSFNLIRYLRIIRNIVLAGLNAMEKTKPCIGVCIGVFFSPSIRLHSIHGN